MPRNHHRLTPPAAASPSTSKSPAPTTTTPQTSVLKSTAPPTPPSGPAPVTTPVAPTTAPAPAPAAQVIVPAHPRSTCRPLLPSDLRRCHNLARLDHQTCWAHANTPAASLVAADDEDDDYVTESDSDSEEEEEEEEEEVVHRGRRRGSSVRFDLRVTTEEGEEGETRRGDVGRAERAEQRREDHDLDQADLVTGFIWGFAGANASRRRTREALDRLAQVLRDWEI